MRLCLFCCSCCFFLTFAFILCSEFKGDLIFQWYLFAEEEAFADGTLCSVPPATLFSLILTLLFCAALGEVVQRFVSGAYGEPNMRYWLSSNPRRSFETLAVRAIVAAFLCQHLSVPPSASVSVSAPAPASATTTAAGEQPQTQAHTETDTLLPLNALVSLASRWTRASLLDYVRAYEAKTEGEHTRLVELHDRIVGTQTTTTTATMESKEKEVKQTDGKRSPPVSTTEPATPTRAQQTETKLTKTPTKTHLHTDDREGDTDERAERIKSLPLTPQGSQRFLLHSGSLSALQSGTSTPVLSSTPSPAPSFVPPLPLASLAEHKGETKDKDGKGVLLFVAVL